MSEGLVTHPDGVARCWWCGADPLYVAYHDTEWGVPEYDGRALFEKLILDGFQAGLSWITILRKRDAFRAAFAAFDPERIARFDQRNVETLMQNAGIVRNRAKIEAAISNARLVREMPPGAFDELMWSFAPPARPRPTALAEVPAVTAESEEMSRALRRGGFRFVGPTTMYALMQSAGMVDDHVAGCHRAA